jgi:ATP-dependent Clp protease ATP-binding subunit ClpA
MADARNSIVIMTANLLGPHTSARRLGFAPGEDAGPVPSTEASLRTIIGNLMPGKFIDRIDAIVKFNPLVRSDLEEIARQKITEVIDRAAALYRVSVEADPEVASWVVEKAASESSGARAIQRCVETFINVPLGTVLNESQVSRSDRVRISVNQDAIQVELASAGR